MPNHPPHPPREDIPRINIEYQRRQCPIIDIAALAARADLPSMRNTMAFIMALKNALLNDPVAHLGEEALKRLWNPPDEVICIDNPGTRFSIAAYLALENTSQIMYNRVCQAARIAFASAPGGDSILSFHNIEKLIASYTGVVSIEHDMCHNTCIVYTGPFAHLDMCPTCTTSHWKEEMFQGTHGRSKVATQTFTTVPIGPQLQALYRNKDSAADMDYLRQRTEEVLQQIREMVS